MKLILRNTETTLALETPGKDFLGYGLSEPPLIRRVSLQSRFGKPGAFAIGDKRVGARPLTLQTDITGITDSEYTAQLSNIVKIFDLEKQPWFLENTDASRRTKVELLSITPSPQVGMEKRHAPLRIELSMIDGFWEDLTLQSESSPSGGTASGETISVPNEGDDNSYPLIIVTPTDSNSNFSILNNTTSDIITIGSTAFVVGTTLEIDSRDGLLLLNDGNTKTEISFAIADGTGFMFLTPGTNVLQYDSNFGAVDIQVDYRQQYAF